MSQAMISALYLICSHYKIALERTVIADWGIYTVGVQPTGLEVEVSRHLLGANINSTATQPNQKIV